MRSLRGILCAMAVPLAATACAVTAGAGRIGPDSQLIVSAMTPVVRDLAASGTDAASIAEADRALATARTEADSLARQSVPTRLDVQEFVLAAATLTHAAGMAAHLSVTDASATEATNALLPGMATAVDASSPKVAPARMTPDQARLLLQAAAGSPTTASAPPASAPIPSTSTTTVVAPAPLAPPAAVAAPKQASVTAVVGKLEAAIRRRGWTVYATIDRLPGQPSTWVLILFGNPPAEAAAIRDDPARALDIPGRALVWRDSAGNTDVTVAQSTLDQRDVSDLLKAATD